MPLLQAAAQLLALIPLLFAIYLTWHLPADVATRHHIYHDLESSQARILMPAKLETSLLAGQAERDSKEGVLDCGFSVGAANGRDSGTAHKLPAWMLPDDNSGLDKLALTLVRTNSCLQGCAYAKQ